MSNTILIRRSSTPGSAPTTGQISLGELAINTYDGRLYTKIDDGTAAIFELTENQLIQVTGNVVGNSVNNGNGTSNIALTLTTTGVTANTYGGTSGATTYVGQFTVDSYGRITSASNVAISTSSLSNGTSNLQIYEDGNIAMSVSGVGNVVVVTAAGIETSNISASGTVSATGNVTGGNINSGGLASITGNVTGGNINSGGLASITGNVTGGNLITAGSISGASVSASGNVTSGNVLTGGLISATGNVTGGNVNSGGLASITGNVTGGNLITAGSISGASVSASGNVTGGNLITSGALVASNLGTPGNLTVDGFASVAGTVTGGDFDTAGNVSATGTITADDTITGGNVATGGLISATGNVTGGNVNTSHVVGSSAFDITAGGAIPLIPTGNVILGTGGSNVVINNVADPVQDNDAANKLYVDNVAQGLHVHAPCLAATPDTLATITSGTVTYDNGSSGVGATLTTTGSYANIDGVPINSSGTRILVKNEANAAHNGIYVYSNATVITRSSDFDTPVEMGGGDFTFVQQGTLYNDTGWVMTDPVVTVGTSNVTFLQFSGAGTFTAGNALTLNGTQFNVNVDTSGDNTIGINGSNELYIPANANLTTPNIGAATGTSVSVTGNVTSGNINTGGLISSTGNVTGGNINTGGLVSATGNVTGGNVNTGGLVLATGNITGGNISTVGIANIATLEVTTLANIKATTISTSTTTGALQVAGGVGVVGNIYAGAMYSGGEAVLTVNSTVDGGTY